MRTFFRDRIPKNFFAYDLADTMRLGEKIYPGDYLLSEDGNFNLTMGDFGNIQMIYLPLGKSVGSLTTASNLLLLVSR